MPWSLGRQKVGFYERRRYEQRGRRDVTARGQYLADFVYCKFQLKFAAITVALVTPAVSPSALKFSA